MTDGTCQVNDSALLPIHVGCAGWGLSSKVSAHFRTDGSHLERYARVFSSVEINSSFYRTHQPKTYARWAASVPDAFRFSVKIPRVISHERKLRVGDFEARTFLGQVASLGDKLGCLLLQLPPSLALNMPEALSFFSMLHGLTSTPVVCEPRHASWFSPEAAEFMNTAGIALVRAHPPPIPGVEPAADPHTLYIRLHGAPHMYYSAYDGPFVDAVALRIADAHRLHKQVWCIFDNTASGEAVPNALTLMERLEAMGLVT